MVRALSKQTTTQQVGYTLTSAVGLYRFTPQTIAWPTSEAEIVQLVRSAAQRGWRVRAIGALHSAVPIPATDGLCLSLEGYSRLLSVEGTKVTVQAGIKLLDLNQALVQYGLALPVMGTIAEQTIAGAISTGTHGGSLHCTSLSGYVHSFRIVRADGTVLTIQRGDELFNGSAIALGALGILSTVTLECVPAFSLSTKILSLPAAELLKQFDALNRQNRFVDMRYSPITDRVHIALMNRTAESVMEPLASNLPLGPHPKSLSRGERDFRSGSLLPLGEGLGMRARKSELSGTSFKHTPPTEDLSWQPNSSPAWINNLTDRSHKLAQRLFATHRFNWLQRWGIAYYDRHIYQPVSGRSDFVLTHFDATSTDLLKNEQRSQLDPVADMELAIDYSQTTDAIARLRHHFQSTRQFPSMHIHLRTQAAEPFWLSPTGGQPICWLEIWEYPRTGRFFKQMATLLAPYNPRGHWGKQLPASPAEQYPHWSDFLALRDKWDPERRFTNDYLDRYL